MAKDSTAVQKLIELAQQKPIDVDLGGLFESDPPKRTALPPPRPTAMHPTGGPPPTPRSRPSGTQNALTAIPAGTPAPERIEHAPPRVVDDAMEPMSGADELFGMRALPPLPIAGPAAPPPVIALPPRRPSAAHAAAPAPPLPRPPAVTDELPTSPVQLAEMEEGDWFQQSEAVPMVDDFFIGTQSVEKTRSSALVAIAAAFGLGLVVAGGYLVYSRVTASDAAKPARIASKKVAAPAAAAAPKPAPVSPSIAAVEQVSPPAPVAAAPTAPTVTPIEAAPAVATTAAAVPAPAPAPAAAGPVAGTLVDVALKSEPSGVTVMLIDGGGAVKLGVTPTFASLSAGTQHQILFSRDGYTATMATIDPAAQTDVMVALAPTAGGNPAPAPAPTVVAIEHPSAPTPTVRSIEPAPAPVAPAPAPAPKHDHAKATHSEHVAARTEHAPSAPTHAAPKRTATAVAGTGTLMIGAKPPCEIIVDGRATGLTTPQRAINLPPGSHSITLVNHQNNIKKSFSVSINAGSPTKVVKDFTSMMKK